jgi:hypothetical protein
LDAGTRCRWVNNIKMDLTEIGWVVTDLIDLAQNKEKLNAVNTVMYLQVA